MWTLSWSSCVSSLSSNIKLQNVCHPKIHRFQTLCLETRGKTYQNEKNNLDFQRYLPKAPAYFSKIDKKTVEQKTFTQKSKIKEIYLRIQSYSQLMIGVSNHLRNAWYLGSITILSFGEPGSLGHQKRRPPFCWFQIQVPSKPRFVQRLDIFEPFEDACDP